MREQRLEEMLEYIQQNRIASIDTLCRHFNISRNTVHRDVGVLVERGSIRKTYGGVVANHQAAETVPFEERYVKSIGEKKKIGVRAAALLEENDSIFIDSGSTATCFYESIPADLPLTIVTNNIDVLNGAQNKPNHRLIFTGGMLARKTNSVTGTEALAILKKYNIAKAFLSATGLSELCGATNSTHGEYEVKCAVVECARQIIMMVDASKFGVTSLLTFCSFADIDTLVTDRQPDPRLSEALKINHVTIQLA